jgi:predicted RNase H-like HicB family nuclease
MPDMTTYDVELTREGGVWLVEVPGVPGYSIRTFGRTLDQAESMARDAIATALDVSVDSFDLRLRVAEADPTLDEVRRAREAREAAARDEQATLARAVRRFTESGVSQRDAARLLGLSHQRINQLLHAS